MKTFSLKFLNLNLSKMAVNSLYVMSKQEFELCIFITTLYYNSVSYNKEILLKVTVLYFSIALIFVSIIIIRC